MSPRPARPAVPPAPTAPTVLYIGGSHRSGSTLVDRMLAQLPGVVAVGELDRLWVPGVLAHRLCGCGALLRECPFWTAVAGHAFGGWGSPEFEAAIARERAVTRLRLVPLHLLPALGGRFRRDVAASAELLSRIYDVVAAVSGQDVVVDSSKTVAYGLLVRRAVGARMRLVHLVRHAGGVAYSWTKVVDLPVAGDGGARLRRYRPARTAVFWLGNNLLLDLLVGRRVPGVVVTYESIVTDPGTALERILRLAGRPAAPAGFLDDTVVTLAPSHSVAGNPMRFRQGRLPLRLDEQWRRGLAGRDRRLVTLIAAPLLWRYGYLAPRRAASGTGAGRPRQPAGGPSRRRAR